ncbi:hypothetical protein [Terracidiphilus sp.]|uniref:hypothetical protein n=1 Tax=Terracidiphilus sp. TaxID=1964191 RepID=UPI003C25C9B5
MGLFAARSIGTLAMRNNPKNFYGDRLLSAGNLRPSPIMMTAAEALEPRTGGMCVSDAHVRPQF